MKDQGWYTFCFVLLMVSTTYGQQTVALRGFVRDAEDHQPLVGSHVLLIAPDSTIYGTVTDADGFYSIANAPPGSYRFHVSYIGYTAVETEVSLPASEIVRRDVELSSWDAAFEEVIVRGERDEGGATLKSAGVQAVKPADIERVPIPGVSPDLASYLTQLPGIVSSGDRGGLLFIRGGSPPENGVFVDGMMLYQPFHILGFYSAFPSDLVSQTDLYAGGFGAEFGGRLSAIIDISARTGSKGGVAGSASISPFMAAARLEGPVVPGSVSFLASARRSLVEEIGSDVIDEPLPYRFSDAFGKLHANLSSAVQVAVTGIASDDRGVIAPLDSIESSLGRNDEIRWSNRAAGARFLVLPSSFPVLAEFLVSYSYFKNAFGREADPIRRSEIQRAGGIVNATYFAQNLDINFGFSANTISLDNELGGQFQQLVAKTEYLTEGWAYVETEFKSLRDLKLSTGVRIHSYPSVSYTSVEPRARATWAKSNHQISLAAGLYSQEITGVSDRRDPGDVFTAWVPAQDIGDAPKAGHIIAGYRYKVGGGLNLSVEGFYKSLSNLVIPEWTAFPRLTTNLHAADGDVVGLDLRLELNRRHLYAFVGYGYSDVEYVTRNPSVELWYGTTDIEFSPPHDRLHQLTTMGQVTVAGFEFSVLWQFGSGTPFTKALGFDEYIMMFDSYEGVDIRETPGLERVIYGKPYADRLPAYHRLDLSLGRTFRMGKHVDTTVKFDLINALDRDNLLYLDLFTLVRVDQLPRFYSLGLRIDFR